MAGGAAYAPPPPSTHQHHAGHHASSSYRPSHDHRGQSPASNHSSPYVSPRLGNRGPDPATIPTATGYAPPMRRGAVSGASGPLSFPSLPNSMRRDSLFHRDTSGSSPYMGNSGHYDRGREQSERQPTQQQQQQQQQQQYYADGAGGHYQPHSHQSNQYGAQTTSWGGSGYHPEQQYRQGSYSSASGHNFLSSSSSNSGPSFPISSSYSLSSAGSNPANFAGGQPPYAGTQRRSIFGSSLAGVHGNGGLPPPPAPYWQPSTAVGSKRKQTSANPPPRNYACPSCPASFSRRHDLNRHSRIHLAVKPFGCPNCAKSFSRKDALKRHLVVKGCGKDSEGRPKKRRGRKSAAELAAAAAAAKSDAETGQTDGLGVYDAARAAGDGYYQGSRSRDGGSDEDEEEEEEGDEEGESGGASDEEDYSMADETANIIARQARTGSLSFHMT